MLKNLSYYLFLIFFSFLPISFADDIQDFELDGVSIGDSLLNYMTEDAIMSQQEESNNAYKHLGKQIFFEVYMLSNKNDIDFKSFFVKSNDKNFIIQAIYATKTYETNVDECLIRLNNITKIYDKNFKNVIKNSERLKILHDPSGKSYLERTTYKFKNGDTIAIECYDFDETMQKDYGYQNPDSFNISFNNKELYLWINS